MSATAATGQRTISQSSEYPIHSVATPNAIRKNAWGTTTPVLARITTDAGIATATAIQASGCSRRRHATARMPAVRTASAAALAAPGKTLKRVVASSTTGNATIAAPRPWKTALGRCPRPPARSASASHTSP